MLIVYTLTSFIKQYITLKIVYFYSVQSVSMLIISTVIAGKLYHFIDFILRQDKHDIFDYVEFTLGLIVFVIISFGIMVYDEIIIVNKCGLNLNIAKGIQERSLTEFESIIHDLESEGELDKSGDLITNVTNDEIN